MDVESNKTETAGGGTHGMSDKKLPTLALTALGIVFGDIGTSPLYTLKTVIDLAGGKPTAEMSLGLLSLIIWTLLVTVSLKYVVFVMRADNAGEGGILALMSLLKKKKHHRPLIIAFGLFGAALIYGDGAITPAISVLSAIEGIKLAAPHVESFILPLSVFILIGLFAVQWMGTARIGWVFGPIMAVWFITIGALGIHGIAQYPAVLWAFDPWHGIHFLFANGVTGFFVLGGVFLAITGAEALYADMGHVGALAIRIAWYGFVLPSLLLNYAGQTAYMLAGNPLTGNIFYLLCPQTLLVPLIVLATVATIIASQAIITGAFSMTRQAIQLGWCPRLRVTQTSSESYGQIYVGAVNWMLMIVTLALTIMFGSSDNLAAAYGVAVSLTMLLTTALMFVVMREIWHWKLPVSILVAGTFSCIDAAFFGANILKMLQGGWVPLFLAACVFIIMRTWRHGSICVARGMRSLTVPVDQFIHKLSNDKVLRVPGTAVFLSKASEKTPPIIIWYVEHNRALHQHVVALSLVVAPTPTVNPDQRLTVEKIAEDFWRMIVHYGFMEKLDVPAAIKQAKDIGHELDLSDITYYIGYETIIHCPDGTGMPLWEETLYAFMQRNATHVSEYLSLPRDAVVEIGRQIEI